MAEIEMLDSDGNVTETIENVHACIGESGDAPGCYQAAFCNTCGEGGCAAQPVFVFTSETGLDYFECAACIAEGGYARLVFGDNACVDHGLEFPTPTDLTAHLRDFHMQTRLCSICRVNSATDGEPICGCCAAPAE